MRNAASSSIDAKGYTREKVIPQRQGIISESLKTISNLQKITVPEGTDLSEAIQELGIQSWVEYAEPNYIYEYSDTIPNK